MRAAIVVAVAIAVAPARAHADERWYGHHVLAADLAGWGLIGGGVCARSWGLAVTGAVVLTFGAPVVHLSVHENLGRAGISLGLRTVLPALGLAVGMKGARNDDHELVGSAPGVAVVVASVIASIIDIAVVAREDEPGAAPRTIAIGGRF